MITSQNRDEEASNVVLEAENFKEFKTNLERKIEGHSREHDHKRLKIAATT